MTLIKFDQFVVVANFLYKTIFQQPYGNSQNWLLHGIFITNMISLNLCLMCEIAFIYSSSANQVNFLEVTMNVAFASMVATAIYRILKTYFEKPKINRLMCELRRLYPSSQDEQNDYEIGKTFQLHNRLNRTYVYLYFLVVWIYNVFPIIRKYIYQYKYGQNIALGFPYYVSIPWDYRDHWSFYAVYIILCINGYTCVTGFLSNDSLMCAVVFQVIAHFRYLEKRIQRHVAGVNVDKDMQFLSHIVQFHQRILSMSQTINEIFGSGLLLNFISTTFVICTVGFNMTIDFQIYEFMRLSCFLFAGFVQFAIICYCGEELKSVSERIGAAIYEHDWYGGDLRYKKMLTIISTRAQKPTVLRAEPFFDINLIALATLVQSAYKIFTLLNKIYTD